MEKVEISLTYTPYCYEHYSLQWGLCIDELEDLINLPKETPSEVILVLTDEKHRESMRLEAKGFPFSRCYIRVYKTSNTTYPEITSVDPEFNDLIRELSKKWKVPYIWASIDYYVK